MRWKFLHVIGTIALAFVLSLLLSADISTYTFLTALDMSNDFKVGDFYNRLAEMRATRVKADGVVIVDVGDAGRDEIARAIDLAATGQPAAIGVDFTFPGLTGGDGDLLLAETLDRHPEVIMAQGLSTRHQATPDRDEYYDYGSTSFFHELPRPYHYAATRLLADRPINVVREFADSFPLRDGLKMQSFATALVAHGRPDAYEQFRRQCGHRAMIDYPSRWFKTVTLGGLPDSLDILKGQIVIIGDLSGLGDMHRTPIADQSAGVVIQASIVATILEGTYPVDVPQWATWAIGIVLLTVILLARHILTGKSYMGLVTRLLQIGLFLLVVYVGCQLFFDHRIVLDAKKPLLMILFGLLSLDMWMGFYGLGCDILRNGKKLKAKWNKNQ